MSGKIARIHNHVSNRARNKGTGERKVVFKGFLDSPFRIQWPVVTKTTQTAVLDASVNLLSGIADCRKSSDRKRTSAQQKGPRKRRKQVEADAGRPAAELISIMDNNVSPDLNLAALECPSVARRQIVVGINEVTKQLEQQVHAERVTRITLHPSEKSPSSLLSVILVCRSDINPEILVDHLPHLVATLNSLRPEQLVRLVPLQTGAETRLSQAVGLRRAAVLGFDSTFPNLDSILELLKDIPILSATWLASSISIVERFVPTHVKQVRTSVPKDMKAVKQARKEKKSKREKRRSNEISKGISSTIELESMGTKLT